VGEIRDVRRPPVLRHGCLVSGKGLWVRLNKLVI
jgi:hypothetical protein